MLKSSNQIWFKWFFKSDVTKCSNLIWFKLDLRGDLKGLEHNLKIRSGQGLENGFEMNSSRGPYGGYPWFSPVFSEFSLVGKFAFNRVQSNRSQICLEHAHCFVSEFYREYTHKFGLSSSLDRYLRIISNWDSERDLKGLEGTWKFREHQIWQGTRNRFENEPDSTWPWLVKLEKGLEHNVKMNLTGTRQYIGKFHTTASVNFIRNVRKLSTWAGSRWISAARQITSELHFDRQKHS